MSETRAADMHAAQARDKRKALPQLLAALCAGHGRRMALGLLLASATALMGALLLGISGWFITGTAVAGLAASTALAFDIFMPSASIRLLALGRTASRYGERVVTHAAALFALVGVREKLFRGMAQQASDAQRQQQWRLQPARLLLRLTRDLQAAEALYLRLLVPACAALAATLGIALWLAWHHIGLGLVWLLWLLGAGWGVTWWLLRASTALTLAQSRHGERLREQALDLAAGQAELVMAGRFDAALARWTRRQAHLVTLQTRLQHADALAAGLWQWLHTLTMVGALGTAAWLVIERGMSVPVGAFFVLMALAGMEPFAALRRGAADWAATVLAARRLQGALVQAGESAEHSTIDSHGPHPRPLSRGERGESPSASRGTAEQPPAPTPNAERRALNLSKVSVHSRVACSLDVAAGERLALIGPSGSGKSTVLALLGGWLRPDAGEVQTLPSVALLQQAAVFGDSVRANVDIQQRQLPDAHIWAALDAAGLRDAIAAREGGLDALLGEGGLGLSRGQARRLALARLFALQGAGADVWLLDEPTDGLDAATAADVLARLAAAVQGKTVVIATHLRRGAALADRLVRMEGGRITGEAQRGTRAFDAMLEGLRDD